MGGLIVSGEESSGTPRALMGADFDMPAEVSQWLENTGTSGAQSTWFSRRTSANAVQAVAGRQPTANADGSLTFTAANPSVMVWPVDASGSGNNPTTGALGFGFHFKPVSVGVSGSLVWGRSTNALNVNKFELRQSSNRLLFSWYSNDTTGRSANSTAAVVLTTNNQYVEFFYDPSLPGDSKISGSIDGNTLAWTFVNIGAGAPFGDLRAATGSLAIGNAGDGTPALALNGKIGGDFVMFSSKVSAPSLTILRNRRPITT